eukprot:g15393.t1
MTCFELNEICDLGPTNCHPSAYYDNFLGSVSPSKGRGQSFPYNFISDIWNGFSGDAGWVGCKAFNNPHTQCQYVVHNIKVYTVNGSPMFSGKCGAMNGDAQDNTSCFDACIPHGTHETCHGIFCDQTLGGSTQSTPKDVLLNAATMATAELNAEHLAAGTSRALDAVIHVATAAALQEERQAVGVRIITDAPGLADHGSEGANLLHFDIAFGLCAPQAALEAAESEKRQFERVLGQVAAQRYEAFKISTIRLLELEPRFQTEASSTSQYQVAPLPQEEEPPDLWAEIWWLPWLGCIMVLLAANFGDMECSSIASRARNWFDLVAFFALPANRENFDTSLPGSTVAVPPLWNGDGFRQESAIPAPPPRKPPPLRNSTIAPWVLAARQQDVQEDEEGREDDFLGSDEGTPPCYPSALPGTILGNLEASDVDDAFQGLGPDRPVEYEAWIDAGRPIEEVQSRIDNLIRYNWIDRRTQNVQIDAFFVNLQTTVYARMELRIQVYREGLIKSLLRVVPVRSRVVTHWSHIFLNLCFVTLV